MCFTWLAKNFQTSLTFVSKVGAYLRGAPRSSPTVCVSLSQMYLTSLKKLDVTDKRTSLLYPTVIEKEKVFATLVDFLAYLFISDNKIS
jgi:hypothetical protein